VSDSIVQIIADTHYPFVHPYYMEFCLRTRDEWKANKFVHIGDEVDNHAISMHDSELCSYSMQEEGKLAEKHIKDLEKEYPVLDITEGNHSALPYRRAKKGQVPLRFLRTHNEAWGVGPGWKWHQEIEIDGVIYHHGTTTGKTAALNSAIANQQSTVQGHTHTYGGVGFTASRRNLIFGMNVGCGIDVTAYAYEYGKKFTVKPTLGCGIVINGEKPFFIPMPGGSKPLPRKKKPKRTRKKI
jgi:hypothetical protein